MTRLELSLRVASGLVLVCAPAWAAPALAAEAATDRLDVQLAVVEQDGTRTPLDEVDASDPLPLDPDSEVVLDLDVTNEGEEAVSLRSVRMQGQVLGMTFFDYATRVDLPLPPGEQVELSLPLDLSALGEQATGLLPTTVTLTGPEREVLADEAFPVDVQGSLWSTYGVFGLLVAVVTAVLLVAALVRLALGLLPRHRWLRASRFAVPGLGVGLTLTFTLSVLGVLVPSAGSWVTIVVVGGLVGLVAGYLTPGPDRRPRPRDDDAPDSGVDELLGPADDRTRAPDDEHRTIVLPDAATPSPRRPRAGAAPAAEAERPRRTPESAG